MLLLPAAQGFVGSTVGKHLNDRGFNVVLLDNMSAGFHDNLVFDEVRFEQFVEADVKILDNLQHN